MWWTKLLEKAPEITQSSLGIGTGAYQLNEARKNKKAAEANMPQGVDPQQAAFADELNQKRESINTGSAYAAGMNEADQGQASANSGIVNATGGDVQGTVDALIKAQRASGEQRNNILAQGDASQRFYTGMYGSMVDKIAQRKLELQLLRHNQNMAEWATNRKAGMANLMGGIMTGSTLFADKNKTNSVMQQNPLQPTGSGDGHGNVGSAVPSVSSLGGAGGSGSIPGGTSGGNLDVSGAGEGSGGGIQGIDVGSMFSKLSK